MISFILNNKIIHTLTNPATPLLDFIRYESNLKGTKIGCREGDCGACTILVGEIINDKLSYRSVTSCLFPLANAVGKHIVTIEGINREGALNPIQEAMSNQNATQCGFCTVGFVMSLTGYALNKKGHEKEEAIASIDGNICRCTGYKSIEKAAGDIVNHCNAFAEGSKIERAIACGAVPAYFQGIEDTLKELTNTKEDIEANGWTIGGGTDLYVQKHDELLDLKNEFISQQLVHEPIKITDSGIELDGRCTVTQFVNEPLIMEHFPCVKGLGVLVSSTPIRNMATLAGNLVNASPIGDMSILFLALNASIELTSAQGIRSIPLSQFYQGYKKLDKTKEEILTKILIPKRTTLGSVNFEKVSKRTWLDIASVNSTIWIELDGNNIKEARISAGGVGPTPAILTQTSTFLKGKNISSQTISEACEMAQNEVSPISDARGTVEYKKLLLSQLIKAHFLELFGIV
ncbi:MAG: FAD binding domain-containing protein [Saprospiraceae bacterium]|nr:FAD binding domain-containing protein [Saprospiraceae bacterium]